MRALSTVCDPKSYECADWMAIHRELETYSLDKHVFLHTNGGCVYRKGWEWTQCIDGLKTLGALRSDSSALGVGSGRECLSFYLADRRREVIASDLYGNELWSHQGGREAAPEILDDPSRFCPRAFRRESVRFVHADGTHLPFDASRFDICWSMSSIEHFGGHEKAAQAVSEMARVTKPGGIIAMATELLLLPEYQHPEYFTRDEIVKYLIAPHTSLEVVGEIDWNLPPLEYLIDSINFPQGAERLRRHVVLNDGSVQWTSILLFYRKL